MFGRKVRDDWLLPLGKYTKYFSISLSRSLFVPCVLSATCTFHVLHHLRNCSLRIDHLTANSRSAPSITAAVRVFMDRSATFHSFALCRCRRVLGTVVHLSPSPESAAVCAKQAGSSPHITLSTAPVICHILLWCRAREVSSGRDKSDTAVGTRNHGRRNGHRNAALDVGTQRRQQFRPYSSRYSSVGEQRNTCRHTSTAVQKTSGPRSPILCTAVHVQQLRPAVKKRQFWIKARTLFFGHANTGKV